MNKILVPGPDHPITMTPGGKRVVVKLAGTIIADSKAALTLREASYPPVWYIPRVDADISKLERSAHKTYCPYKGECSYFSIPAGGARGVNAVWSYEDTYEAVAAIKGHLAFYPDRMDGIEELPLDG